MTIQNMTKVIYESGLTQKDIANKLDISQNSVWQYLNGKVETIGHDTYLKLEALHKEITEKAA